MATNITISVGALSRQRTFQDDAKASAALLEFYKAYNIGSLALTNGEKLDLIIDWFVSQVVNVSVQSYVDTQRPTDLSEGEALYKFNP